MGDGRQRPGRRQLRFPPGGAPGAPRLLQACGDGRIKRDGGEGARPSFSGRRKAFQNHMENRSGALLRMHKASAGTGSRRAASPLGKSLWERRAGGAGEGRAFFRKASLPPHFTFSPYRSGCRWQCRARWRRGMRRGPAVRLRACWCSTPPRSARRGPRNAAAHERARS